MACDRLRSALSWPVDATSGLVEEEYLLTTGVYVDTVKAFVRARSVSSIPSYSDALWAAPSCSSWRAGTPPS